MTKNSRRPLSRKSIRRHVRRLAQKLSNANAMAWDTVGRPGPVFTNTKPGPDKDQAWVVHNEECSADLMEAVRLFQKALASAPAWLLKDPRLVARVFSARGLQCLGPGM